MSTPNDHDPPDNRGKGSGDWECFGCGALHEALTEGFGTRCSFCGSYELHLSDAAKRRLRGDPSVAVSELVAGRHPSRGGAGA